jgi:hypothetical protein
LCYYIKKLEYIRDFLDRLHNLVSLPDRVGYT